MRMRPLLVELGRDYRGGQHQALLLLQGLVARGHAPELITIRDSLLAQRAKKVGVRVHLVERRWRRLAAALAIRKLLSRRAVEIVHANEPHALTAAWLARAHRRVPLIASRRVIFPLSKDGVSLARYRAAATIVAVSECVASAVVASGLPRERITVIPDGVPIPAARCADEREAARHSLGIESNALLVGCVATLTPDKGQDILIRALAAVRAQFPRCQLLLAGDGSCRAELAALAREHGVGGEVHFAGFVEDVDRVYAAIDMFAFPAQAEALGTALLSAMAHGLPVVALARGGISEAVEDGKNGLLVKDFDAAAFASAIVQLLAHPEEATQLGKAAGETILARFSADEMVNETLRLYENLAREHVPRIG
jgi:glycosyltransferase involved in cell wall biosynthesis